MRKYRAERYNTALNMKICIPDTCGQSKWVDARVLNVSKTGVGIRTEEELSDTIVYQTKIYLNEGQTVDALINLLSRKKRWNGYVYGGTFIGLDENEWAKILSNGVFR